MYVTQHQLGVQIPGLLSENRVCRMKSDVFLSTFFLFKTSLCSLLGKQIHIITIQLRGEQVWHFNYLEATRDGGAAVRLCLWGKKWGPYTKMQLTASTLCWFKTGKKRGDLIYFAWLCFCSVCKCDTKTPVKIAALEEISWHCGTLF